MSVDFEASPPRVEGDALVFDVRVPDDLVYFDGHFDGAPVLPAVAQLEALVLPLCRSAWRELASPRRWLRLKFRRPVAPGDGLTVRLSRRAGAAVVAFTLQRGGEVVSSGAADFTRVVP